MNFPAKSKLRIKKQSHQLSRDLRGSIILFLLGNVYVINRIESCFFLKKEMLKQLSIHPIYLIPPLALCFSFYETEMVTDVLICFTDINNKI